jgi:hypothetical protein
VKRLLSFILAGLVAASFAVSAQLRRPEATITPFVDGVAAAGSSIRLGLKVALPEDLHTQSNAPRDPTLIATKLTIDPVDGVTIRKSSGLRQPISSSPVSTSRSPCSKHEFPIGRRRLSSPIRWREGNLTAHRAAQVPSLRQEPVLRANHHRVVVADSDRPAECGQPTPSSRRSSRRSRLARFETGRR